MTDEQKIEIALGIVPEGVHSILRTGIDPKYHYQVYYKNGEWWTEEHGSTMRIGPRDSELATIQFFLRYEEGAYTDV